MPHVVREFEASDVACSEERAGQVVLRVVVSSTGFVSSATVVQSGGAAFDATARDALLQFRFAPACLDGAPISAAIIYKYRFELPR